MNEFIMDTLVGVVSSIKAAPLPIGFAAAPPYTVCPLFIIAVLRLPPMTELPPSCMLRCCYRFMLLPSFFEDYPSVVLVCSLCALLCPCARLLPTPGMMPNWLPLGGLFLWDDDPYFLVGEMIEVCFLFRRGLP